MGEIGLVPRQRDRATLRRWILFLSFLISGGLLLFPRIPVMVLILALCPFVPGFRFMPRREAWPIVLFLGAVVALTVMRPGPLHLESLATRMANFITGLMLLNLYACQSTGALARDLYVILKWFCIQALGTVALGYAMDPFFVTIDVSGTSYRTLLLIFNYHFALEGASIRPDGFFFEPGVFQAYLNLYVYLALFLFRKRGHAALGVLAVFSTQSTTGIAICLMLLAARFWQQLGEGRMKAKVASVFVALLVSAPVGYIAYDNIQAKLVGEAQGSAWAREYDLFTGLNVIAENPLLGIGFDHDQYRAAAGELGYSETLLDLATLENRDTTNGLIYLVYSLGIPLSLPVFIAMFRQRFFRHRMLIGLWLVLTFTGEAIIFTPFFLLIILSGLLARRRLRQRKRRRPHTSPSPAAEQIPA
jgi:hypothetical protein